MMKTKYILETKQEILHNWFFFFI